MMSRRSSLSVMLPVLVLVFGFAAAQAPAPAPQSAPPPAASSAAPAALPSVPRPLDVPDNALVAPGKAPELELLYTGDVIGFIEPCG
jgi:hypothetical protein